MLGIYLQSIQAVDERMKISEKTPLDIKDHSGEGGNDGGNGRDIAALDKFMHFMTDAALLQEAQRFMEAKQPGFATHTANLI
jgi:hypothetical protein